jgi:hypothetical protein
VKTAIERQATLGQPIPYPYRVKHCGEDWMWQGAEHCKDPQGKPHRTENGAIERYGADFPRTEFLRSRERRLSHFLRDERGRPKRLDHQRVLRPSPVGWAKVCVYPDDQLKAIHDCQAPADRSAPDPATEYYRDEDGEWPTEEQLTRLLGVSRNFIKHWMRQPDRVRGDRGKAQRTKPVPSPRHGTGTRAMVRGCNLQDARDCLSGKQSPNPRVGRRARPAVPVKERLRLAKEFVKEMTKGGPRLARDCRALAKERRISLPMQDLARAELGVKTLRQDGPPPAVYWWCRGRQTPPAPGESPAPNGYAPANGQHVTEVDRATAPHSPATPVPLDPDPAPRKRGPKPKEETTRFHLFCYVEFRLKKRKRPRVWADALRFFGKPSAESTITVTSDRFAEKYHLPIDPSPSERAELLHRYEHGELIPDQPD